MAPSLPAGGTVIRIAVVVLLSVCTAWMLFLAVYHEDDEGLGIAGARDGIAGVLPGKPGVRTLASMRRRMLARKTPAPVIKPQGRISYLDWLGDSYNLRQCQCRRDWKEQPAGSSICRCRGNCPAKVTPMFLTQATGQSLCSLEESTGFNCYAECENEESQEIKWFAMPCGGDKQEECEPAILAGKKGAAEAAAPAAEAAPPPPPPPPTEPAAAEPPPPAAEAAPVVGGSFSAKLGYDPTQVYDLRGLQCELLDGKEQCFLEDEQGRELCPPHITSEYLASPSDQYLCSPEMAEQYYCTVGCQEGNPEIRWGAHEVAWCDDPKNKGSCPSRPQVYPKADYKLKEWSAAPEQPSACRGAWARGERPKQQIKGVTFGLLTHEPKSFRDSMQTYESMGLFDVVGEFLIYINKRRPEVDEVAEEFRSKHPDVVKVMGTAENVGILRGMNFLIGNASNPYFLFLERDFQLIEPATCVVEQVEAGRKLVEAGTAHVVRYRHRRHPGRPNWAARMFKGHEDDVFKGGQPNLFCNHFYWYDEPEKRWPDKIWVCNDAPSMWCSDSFYCNWTNNPQLWSKSWWEKEYVAQFDSFKRNDPYYDIEMYMNWEPNSWNDRKWIVAQGEGLWKHVDRNNFGTG